MNNILEVKDLCKNYNAFSLKNVNFSMPKGYIMGFIGPNGAGKTTTIKSILDMIHRDGGDIRLFGQSLSAADAQMKNLIGVVMDSPFYVDDWHVKDVEAALAPFYTGWDSAAFAEHLKKFNIAQNKKVKELSRGMKVKLMLAVALSHGAKLLILDEPTSGLDPVARDELMDFLGEFITDENNGVLFSTHITSDLEKVADYITFIINGEIEFSGEKDALLEKYMLVKGGMDELSAVQKKYIIGLREHGFGFEGLAKTDDIKNLPQTLSYEKTTMDEIIVYI
ncbi:MAG: ABC transporter ATP-binding protein [Clostridiales bacterium]|jgi:ABC-2 type transport system ATP-binding protein|nr:ABC transporter ATP-binding protein [Clostridiales bacterium]